MKANIKAKISDEVYTVVRTIPKGKVATYGQIARLVQLSDHSRSGVRSTSRSHSGSVARAVGNVLHKNSGTSVPCHRVVDRNGRLAPNFGGPSLVSFGRRAPSKSRIAGRSGAFDGSREQRRRLEVEGVKFKDVMHVDLATSLWHA